MWIFKKKRPDASQEIGTEVAQALGLLSSRLRNYGLLLAAIKVAASDDDGDIQNFAEDYGMDQVDPIRRIDVLRHALKIVEKDRHG